MTIMNYDDDADNMLMLKIEINNDDNSDKWWWQLLENDDNRNDNMKGKW